MRKFSEETKERFVRTVIWIATTGACYALMTGHLKMEIVPLIVSVLIAKGVTKFIVKKTEELDER